MTEPDSDELTAAYLHGVRAGELKGWNEAIEAAVERIEALGFTAKFLDDLRKGEPT